MKIRTGFVSNSSSSSFIIGYGVISDRKKLKEFFTSNKIKQTYDIQILPSEECLGRILYGGNYTDLAIPQNIPKNTEVLVVEITNDEGDTFFWNETYQELNYDKAFDPDFFIGTQRKLIDILRDSEFLSQKQVFFGAERNG